MKKARPVGTEPIVIFGCTRSGKDTGIIIVNPFGALPNTSGDKDHLQGDGSNALVVLDEVAGPAVVVRARRGGD
jgi:hypothetical protein